MKIKLLLSLGILGLAVATALAVSTDFGRSKPTGETVKNAPQGEFYKGANEKPVYGSTQVEALTGGMYRLKPVLQGDTVEHDFLIKNTSKKIIEFKEVKSCCGLILTGHTPAIVPGATGKFSIVIVTDKFGGQTVNGRITADVIDPAQSDIVINVAMFVNKLASLSQFKIILKGSCREVLEGSTLIVPEKNHPFTVKGIKAKKGLHIEFGVKNVDSQGKKGFLVEVKNTMKKPGVYRDTLFVATDNPERPEIRVRVEAHISQ